MYGVQQILALILRSSRFAWLMHGRFHKTVLEVLSAEKESKSPTQSRSRMHERHEAPPPW